jgi:hypothetical protein
MWKLYFSSLPDLLKIITLVFFGFIPRHHSSLQLQNINGYFYRILKSMYMSDKLCIKVDNKMTEFFTPEVGTDKGCFKPKINQICYTILLLIAITL